MIKPLNDRIVVELTELEKKTASGIVLPGAASEETTKVGLVIAVGSGRVLDNGTRIALEVQKGQKVLFSQYSGTEIEYAGAKYIIVKENDIMAIVE